MDGEVVAQQKFACPACGANAEWNAGKQALVCPFCGTVSPMKVEPGTGAVEEHDLAAALRAIPDEDRGWQAEKISVKCQSCQAITVFDAGRVGQRCEFCGSPALVPLDQIKAPIRPESLLAFKIAESAVRNTVRDWYGSHWFAPTALRTGALTDLVKGLYLPYWTFDAQVAADWTAESGENYWEAETYQDSDGKTQTRQVQQTRWYPSAGHVDHFFEDELVPASMGVPTPLLKKIEPFPTKELVKYDASFLSGWVVEQYQIDLIAAAQRAREMMDAELRQICGKQVPGDTHRDLQVDADYSAQTFKHILVPIWLLTYNYGTKNFQVVINGYTGAIAGKYPLSWIKVTTAVVAGLILLIIILSLYSSHHVQ